MKSAVRVACAEGKAGCGASWTAWCAAKRRQGNDMFARREAGGKVTTICALAEPRNGPSKDLIRTFPPSEDRIDSPRRRRCCEAVG